MPEKKDARRARTPRTAKPYRLQEQVGHLLRRAHQRHCGIFADMLNADLTPRQFAALAMIAECGEVSQNHLGRLVAMDPATTQGVVKRLAERGLVVAGPDEADRRRHVWRTTATGTRLLTRATPAAEAISDETLAPLSPAERRTFLRLLAKIC